MTCEVQGCSWCCGSLWLELGISHIALIHVILQGVSDQVFRDGMFSEYL